MRITTENSCFPVPYYHPQRLPPSVFLPDASFKPETTLRVAFAQWLLTFSTLGSETGRLSDLHRRPCMYNFFFAFALN